MAYFPSQESTPESASSPQQQEVASPPTPQQPGSPQREGQPLEEQTGEGHSGQQERTQESQSGKGAQQQRSRADKWKGRAVPGQGGSGELSTSSASGTPEQQFPSRAGSKRAHEQVDRGDKEGEEERSPRARGSGSASPTLDSKKVAETKNKETTHRLLPWLATLSTVIKLSNEDFKVANKKLSMISDRYQFLENLFDFTQDLENCLSPPPYPIFLPEDPLADYLVLMKHQLSVQASEYIRLNRQGGRKSPSVTTSSSPAAADAGSSSSSAQAPTTTAPPAASTAEKVDTKKQKKEAVDPEERKEEEVDSEERKEEEVDPEERKEEEVDPEERKEEGV
ncbi:hypothetical protein BDB00DRAFT_943542 [Zychaea mexicana]|uniref:uncharacterized protein n=1 Tax=Zychaea mexicana TaxID=64656 RepID=UPI0022FDE563|nr:uncharacterized protein BDB00DRAFT_943542 [Zychaea mexicana]KAI9475345.1 hypothetical protein BDB00DRAFT_943542 [Zychaea mexicana]